MTPAAIHMPLMRYFLWVGAALLLSILVAGAYLPAAPFKDTKELDRSTIRIFADPKPSLARVELQ
jgi:hypothetical protein